MTLPAELTEPLGWVGLTWPEADEELLFEAGQRSIAYGAQLAQIAQRADGAASGVWGSNSGDAVDAFHDWWTREDGPARRLAEDAAAATLIGAALVAFAVITLALKIAFIVQLILLAIEVAQAIATAFVTFGATTASRRCLWASRLSGPSQASSGRVWPWATRSSMVTAAWST